MEVQSISKVNMGQLNLKVYYLAPLCSTTWIKKPLCLFWLFQLSIKRYSNTVYYKLNTTGTELRDSLQKILSEYWPEKTCRKKKTVYLAGNLGRIHGSCSEKPILQRLTQLEGLWTHLTKHVYQQSAVNSK